ncbi:MAG: MerR family DNA-binding transcriptional regulator [Nitrospira sp. CR1.1]|jgi:DNA-binding transcriptional MerR regulator|nr:MerR family DNA-binding transcriptional regulator [Nitrospira sp. CR1.1]
MDDERLLATFDAAKILNCTPDNVRSLERRGHLFAIRTPGGRRIFRAVEVERLAMERQTRLRGEGTDK